MKLRRGNSRATSRGIWGLALILVVAFVGVARPARAHGGGVPQLTNAEAGPYRISAWTQPDPIRVGDLHVSIAVSEPPASDAERGETGDLVLDATVHVRLEPASQAGETLVALATHEGATNRLFYEADVELPTEGRWQVIIEVEGPAGTGSAGFEIEVLPAITFNWTLWGGLGLVLIAVAWSVRAFWRSKS